MFHPNVAAVLIVMLAVFTVGLQGRRVRSLLVGAAMAPVVTVAAAITTVNRPVGAGETVARLALILGALAAGDAWRGRRALITAAAEEAERERDAVAQHRFDQERLRLAHELHDTIAHTLVAINVRAAAAAHHQRNEPGEGLTALEEIKRSSADALTDLRSTLTLLGSAQEGAPLRPAQSFEDLQELVDGVAGAGIDVELRIDGVSGVPTSIAHAAYRIIQESLTNVLRHSSAEHAVVRVSLAGQTLTLQIDDDGRAVDPDTGYPGQGLRGMTERAAALGGHCEAGVAPSGGWRVHARLPTAGTAL